MKRTVLLPLLMAVTLVACGQKEAETSASNQQFPADQQSTPQTPSAAMSAMTGGVNGAMQQGLPPGHPPTFNRGNMGQTDALPPLTQKATVVEAINVPQYTYLKVTQDGKIRWLATTTSAAKKGDTIEFDNGSLMTNFESKVLKRTFDSITFVGRVEVSGN